MSCIHSLDIPLTSILTGILVLLIIYLLLRFAIELSVKHGMRKFLEEKEREIFHNMEYSVQKAIRNGIDESCLNKKDDLTLNDTLSNDLGKTVIQNGKNLKG